MFVARCDLRWSDVDAQGHVNNVALAECLQEARSTFLSSGPAVDLLSQGIVVVSHQIEYVKAALYDTEPLTIHVGVSELLRSRFELAYIVFQKGNVVARARTALCPFDFLSQRPQQLSALQREFFEKNRCDLDPLRSMGTIPALKEQGTSTDIAVRWGDVDRFGHINNVKAFEYLQQARVTIMPLWHESFTRTGAGANTSSWLVARQDVQYVAQLEHRQEPYRVALAPLTVGRTSIVLLSEISDESTGKLYLRGQTVLVSADADGVKKELSSDAREILAKQLVG